MAMGFVADTGDFNFLFEQFNRNKRRRRDRPPQRRRPRRARSFDRMGRRVHHELPALGARKLALDPDDIWAVNPRCVYAIGSGQGLQGPDADQGGFDAVSYWARGGLAHMLTPQGGQLVQPRAARSATRRRRVPRGRGRRRAVQARAHGRADRRRRVAARRGGVDTVERPRPHDDPGHGAAASRRGQESEQRARRIVPHRGRALDQLEHARSRPALGTDVPRARARGAARQSRVRHGRAAHATRARAPPDLRRAHRVVDARGPEGTAVRGGHDLLVDRVAGRGDQRPAGPRERVPAASPRPPEGAVVVVADAVRRARS